MGGLFPFAQEVTVPESYPRFFTRNGAGYYWQANAPAAIEYYSQINPEGTFAHFDSVEAVMSQRQPTPIVEVDRDFIARLRSSWVQRLLPATTVESKPAAEEVGST